MNTNFWDLKPRCSGENIQFKETYLCRSEGSLDVWVASSEAEETNFSLLCLWSCSSSHQHEVMTAGQGPSLSLTFTFRDPRDGFFMHFWEFSYVLVQEFLISRTLRRGSLWPVTSRWREHINNWIVFTVIVTPGCVCVCVVTNRNGRGGGCSGWEGWLRHRGGPLGIWRFILRFPNSKHEHMGSASLVFFPLLPKFSLSFTSAFLCYSFSWFCPPFFFFPAPPPAHPAELKQTHFVAV